jgi:malonyl-CoA O-methyltransferase
MPVPLDRRSVRRAFDRAVTSYDEAAVLQRSSADELLERLEVVRLDPKWIADLGCGTGYLTHRLERLFRGANVVGVDFAKRMLAQARRKRGWFGRARYLAADAERLPFPDRALDLVVSNALLQWCDPRVYFHECARVLAPGGLLAFTTYGPDTLRELRAAWAGVDDGAHVHDFPDMHDLGDLLVEEGFSGPVLDIEVVTLNYAQPLDLLRDLKRLGAVNAATMRARGLTGKARFRGFLRQFERMRQHDGRIHASFEVVYGQAFAAERRSYRQDNGAFAVPLSELRR